MYRYSDLDEIYRRRWVGLLRVGTHFHNFTDKKGAIFLPPGVLKRSLSLSIMVEDSFTFNQEYTIYFQVLVQPMLVRKMTLLFPFIFILYKRFIMNMIRFERSEHLYITELNGIIIVVKT